MGYKVISGDVVAEMTIFRKEFFWKEFLGEIFWGIISQMLYKGAYLMLPYCKFERRMNMSTVYRT